MSLIDDEAMKWALLRAERELSNEDRQDFDAWYNADVRHKGAYVRAIAINNALSRATVQENLRPVVRLPEPARDWTHAYAAGRWNSRRRFMAYGAIAASAGVLATVMRLPSAPSPVVLATAKGEFRKVQLADRSVAAMNSASRIEVQYSDKSREIRLASGEAWFQVTKDRARPFRVEAGAVQVEAVGTAFSVRRHGEGAEILVTEGTVAVWTGDDEQRRLVSAGEYAYVRGLSAAIAVRRSPQEVQRRLAWREGKLVFMNQSLRDAVADFNRYSAKTIIIADPSLEGKTLIGQYRTDAPERFARDVSASLNVPYLVTANEILIGCAS